MWMKIDDGLHAHRKTRAVTRSHPGKSRDCAPMGLWSLAGSWAAQNGTDGWVPAEELDRFDDDWEALVDRLVKAGFWWRQQREGEAGYGFNDWFDYNPESVAASRSGQFGNHVRWHQNKGVVDPLCDHCPTEPDHPESASYDDPESGGDIGGRSGGESGGISRTVALPVPDPTRPDPSPDPSPDPFVADSPLAIPVASEPAPAAARPTKGRRLPNDWQPSEAHGDLARSLGIDVTYEAEKFRDWTRAGGVVKKDWDATFRNWVRNAKPDPRRPVAGAPARLPRADEIEAPPDGLSESEYSDWARRQRQKRRA